MIEAHKCDYDCMSEDSMGSNIHHNGYCKYSIAEEIRRAFKSAPPPTIIIINGRTEIWLSDEITTEQVIQLAYNKANIKQRKALHTVTFRSRNKELATERSGTMLPGNTIRVEPDMVFNAFITNNA